VPDEFSDVPSRVTFSDFRFPLNARTYTSTPGSLVLFAGLTMLGPVIRVTNGVILNHTSIILRVFEQKFPKFYLRQHKIDHKSTTTLPSGNFTGLFMVLRYFRAPEIDHKLTTQLPSGTFPGLFMV
jgi:hypothetical protein